MQFTKRWKVAPPDPAADTLAARLKVAPLIGQVLLNRGLSDPTECEHFLRPSLKYLFDPAGLANITKAADRLARAIQDKEKVVIYGDYDVDGIAATSIMWHALRLQGGNVDYYIPNRLEEGYGMNDQAVAEIADGGAKVLVSVDCGITSLGPARVARERGLDLIITDHHEARRDEKGQMLLPDCFTMVHPKLSADADHPYGNPVLCGAGVAFKLAWAVGLACNGGTPRVSDAYRAFLLDATSLAALATVADVVPLTGENRVITCFGLNGLVNSKLNGIQALIASAGLTGKKLDSYHIGFVLGPRLNACGRMGHAGRAVEMFTVADPKRAEEIATYLAQQNQQRQEVEKQILVEAVEQVKQKGFDRDDCRAIVLASDKWHSGVIGIVASRIVEQFHRPTIMIALNNGRGQGSARSIPGFHLARALEACRGNLIGCGGHEMAAGLQLETSHFEAFGEAFRQYAFDQIPAEMLIAELAIDATVRLPQLTEAAVRDLERLAPFGQGNPRPRFACRQVEVAAPPRRVGRNAEHLQMLVRQDNTSIKCIAFRMGPLVDQLAPGTPLDLAVEPSINEFNGRRNVELNIRDMGSPTA